MIRVHPLGSNSGCINVFFELPIIVPVKTQSLYNDVIRGLEMMLGSVTLTQLTKYMLSDVNEKDKQQILEWIRHHSPGEYSTTLYTILEEGKINQILGDVVASVIRTRDAITDHIQKIATDLDKRMEDLDYEAGTPSAQLYSNEFYKYKRDNLAILCQLCADYISSLKLLEYFVSLANRTSDDESKQPIIMDAPFSWVKANSRSSLCTDCITDERICTLYVMLNARITLLTISDYAGELKRWNDSLYDKETPDKMHRIGHECGVCMGLVNAILHDGDQFKTTESDRLKKITDTGLIPNTEALNLLYKWMFLYKKHVTFMNIVKKQGLSSTNDTHRSYNIDYAKGMSIWCDDVFADMIQSGTTLKPHMVDIQRVFKWVFACAHICKQLSLYYNMEKNVASSHIEYALYWKEKIVEYLETDITKALMRYHKDLYHFGQEHGIMNDIAFYNEFKQSLKESDSDSEESDESSDTEYAYASLETKNVLFSTQYIRGFHVGDYTHMLSDIKKAVKALDAENVKTYYNLKSRKPDEDKTDKDVADKMREKLDTMDKEEVYCEWSLPSTRTVTWDIIMNVSKYLGLWFKTRILDHCK